MSIQLSQILFLAIYAILALAAWKVKSKSFRIGMIVLAALLFLVNPVRFKQEGVSGFERFSNKEVDIPEKVMDNKISFEQKQQIEMNKLKQQSEEAMNEETN